MQKREFLRMAAMGAVSAPFLLQRIDELLDKRQGLSAAEVAKDEDFWAEIRRGYRLKPDYINLESGYYNIIPKPTLEAFLGHVREVNRQGAHYMRTVQWENKKRIAARLAAWLGCSDGELIITRNTTESLDMIITGYPWEPGDEAVYAHQDYGAMQMQFELAARRYGIVNRVVNVPQDPASDEEVVAVYRNAIGPRTRLLMICHMVNITGHILPVRKICDMAHSLGVEVMVDGAHCTGHIPVNLEELGCDYYGSSLHKWLATPLGAGILFVRKDRIPKIWPLLAEHDREPGDIYRLNHTGTHPVHTDLAIDAAMDYLENLGMDRKENRLRELQRRWTEPLRELPGVVIHTPRDPSRSCGIANAGIRGMAPADLARTLLEEFGIFTVAIDGAGVHGCRITPNIFTRTAEVDRLAEALTTIAARRG